MPLVGHGGEALGVVGRGEDGLGDVAADLGGVDVEGRGDLDVADMVAAELDVHQARDRLVAAGVAVVGEALHEGGGAIADADDPDANLLDAIAATPSYVRQHVSAAGAEARTTDAATGDRRRGQRS